MKKITKEEFQNAIELIKSYKIQEMKPTNKKEKICEVILSQNNEKKFEIINYIFLEKEFLKYNEVVLRMHEYLNNIFLFKIGIRNTKIIFKDFLNEKLIKSNDLKFYNTYYK